MPRVQDWPHDSGPGRSHGAAGCSIAQAGFLMNHPLQPAGFLPTAFNQAEAELRSKALSGRDGVTATSAGSELSIAGRRGLVPHPVLNIRARPTIQRSKTIQSP